MVFLLQRKTLLGKDRFLYLSASKAQYDTLQQALAREEIILDFGDYGTVLLEGEGSPSEEDRAFIQKKHLAPEEETDSQA